MEDIEIKRTNDPGVVIVTTPSQFFFVLNRTGEMLPKDYIKERVKHAFQALEILKNEIKERNQCNDRNFLAKIRFLYIDDAKHTYEAFLYIDILHNGCIRNETLPTEDYKTIEVEDEYGADFYLHTKCKGKKVAMGSDYFINGTATKYWSWQLIDRTIIEKPEKTKEEEYGYKRTKGKGFIW